MGAGNFHYAVQRKGRSGGFSAITHAAYITGQKLYDFQELCWQASGQRQRVKAWEILAPETAPAWLQSVAAERDLERLWNVAEVAELKRDGTPRKDATLYRSIVLSLDAGLFVRDAGGRVDAAASARLHTALIREHVAAMFLPQGMAACWALHWNPRRTEDNPHAHIMLPMRAAVEGGFSRYKDGKIKPTDRRHWNDNRVEEQRAHWAAIQSRELKKLGAGYRVEHRSYKRRGIALEAMPKHYGRAERQEERDRQLAVQAERLIRNPRPLLKLLAEAFEGGGFSSGDLLEQVERYTATPEQREALLAAIHQTGELVGLSGGRWKVAGGRRTLPRYVRASERLQRRPARSRQTRKKKEERGAPASPLQRGRGQRERQ